MGFLLNPDVVCDFPTLGPLLGHGDCDVIHDHPILVVFLIVMLFVIVMFLVLFLIMMSFVISLLLVFFLIMMLFVITLF
jgi:hypothetical protein